MPQFIICNIHPYQPDPFYWVEFLDKTCTLVYTVDHTTNTLCTGLPIHDQKMDIYHWQISLALAFVMKPFLTFPLNRTSNPSTLPSKQQKVKHSFLWIAWQNQLGNVRRNTHALQKKVHCKFISTSMQHVHACRIYLVRLCASKSKSEVSFNSSIF